jgi:hypothetical protein
VAERKRQGTYSPIYVVFICILSKCPVSKLNLSWGVQCHRYDAVCVSLSGPQCSPAGFLDAFTLRLWQGKVQGLPAIASGNR